jgi:hypothetical protein
LLGPHGGKVRDLVDVAVLVPCDDYGWVESAHVVLHHALTYAVREAARTEPRMTGLPTAIPASGIPPSG